MSGTKEKRIVSIDYGLARLGVALSDPFKIIASPLPNLACQKKLEKTVSLVVSFLDELEQERGCEIELVLVGLPLMMSGKQGLMADEVHDFVSGLKEAGRWEVRTWDERLTSVQADRSLREGGLRRKQRAKQVDAVSATIILQSYLDSTGLQLGG